VGRRSSGGRIKNSVPTCAAIITITASIAIPTIMSAMSMRSYDVTARYLPIYMMTAKDVFIAMLFLPWDITLPFLLTWLNQRKGPDGHIVLNTDSGFSKMIILKYVPVAATLISLLQRKMMSNNTSHLYD